MKIAVTSVTGKLGASIARHLISIVGSDHVIGIARTPKKATQLGIEVRKGDYNNREEFITALKDIEIVLLISGMDEPQKRIKQHRNVIAAAKANGVKKIVYTSIVGDEEHNAFSPVVQSNRQTERDIQESGMNWTIGRNGIYIEPDLEYLDTYIKDGYIQNCAEDGKCAYTSRNELGYAYAKMLLDEKHNNKIYNLVGDAITQRQLAEDINQVYNTNLTYNSISVNAYRSDRMKDLGDFIGAIIAGIYEGIRSGANDVTSDYKTVTGRSHKSTLQMINEFKSRT